MNGISLAKTSLESCLAPSAMWEHNYKLLLKRNVPLFDVKPANISVLDGLLVRKWKKNTKTLLFTSYFTIFFLYSVKTLTTGTGLVDMILKREPYFPLPSFIFIKTPFVFCCTGTIRLRQDCKSLIQNKASSISAWIYCWNSLHLREALPFLTVHVISRHITWTKAGWKSMVMASVQVTP